MLNLKQEFDRIAQAAGSRPALQFHLDGPHRVYLADHREPNGAYVDESLSRALSIYGALPSWPRILTVRIPADSGMSSPGDFLPVLHLPQPDQMISTGAMFICYWQLSEESTDLRPFFRQIIRSEISPSGLDWLSGSTAIAAGELIYSVLDDSQAQIFTADSSLCESLSRAFPQWL